MASGATSTNNMWTRSYIILRGNNKIACGPNGVFLRFDTRAQALSYARMYEHPGYTIMTTHGWKKMERPFEVDNDS